MSGTTHSVSSDLIFILKGKYMTTQRSFVALLVTVCLWGTLGTALAQEGGADIQREQKRLVIDTRAQSALDELLSTDQNAKALYDQASGYAVFKATKAGFFVTGGGGTGVVINKSTGNRVYMRMGTGGIGLGFGAQRYELVVLLESDRSLAGFINGSWDSSATALAAAGKEGIAVTSSFIDGMAFFQVTDRGLMAAADVAGTRFWVADKLN